MALEFDGERMLKRMDNIIPEHPRKPLCACTPFSCNKLFLFLYGLLYLIVGFGLFVIGVYFVLESKDYTVINNDLFIPTIMMMGIGFIIIINSIVGISGVLKENAALLKLFLVVTVIAFLTQVAIGVLAFIYRQQATRTCITAWMELNFNQIRLLTRELPALVHLIGSYSFLQITDMVPDNFSSSLMFLVKGYTQNTTSIYTATMDSVQTGFKCCGFESYMDYEDNPGFQCGSGRPQDCGVPWTCCRKSKGGELLTSNCGYGVRTNLTMPLNTIYTMGCTDKFLPWLSLNLDIVGAVGLGSSIPQMPLNTIYTMGCTDKFLPWLSLNLDIVGAVGLGSSIPQILALLLAYYLIRRVEENKMWYRVGT